MNLKYIIFKFSLGQDKEYLNLLFLLICSGVFLINSE